MSEATAQGLAARPGTLGWGVRAAREEDAPAVAAAVAALVAELGGAAPPRAAIEAEARAHIADPSLGIVLVAAPEPSVAAAGPTAEPAAAITAPAGPTAEPAAVSSQLSPDSEGKYELAGVLTASWARAIQVAGRLLTIEVLWTRREWRDRGIGAALVEALVAAAAAEGVGRVEVGLPREGFAALRATERFYLANGFERLGPRMRRAVS